MSFEKIFHPNTILKYISIKIDDVEIILDEIISLEIKCDFFGFGFTGSMKIKDSFDMNNNKKIVFTGENVITISIQDFLKNKSIRTYKVTQYRMVHGGERFKIFDIQFIDEISYVLRNAYISKGFAKTPISAFRDCLSYLGIDDIVKKNKMTYDIVDTSKHRSFTIGANESVFDFFSSIFKQENIRIWQDRNSIKIKEIKLNELVPLKDPNNMDIIYTNNTLNNEYIFKIHDFVEDSIPSSGLGLIKPFERVFRFDGKKTIIDNTINLKDYEKNITLNGVEIPELQKTFGEKYKTQANYETGNQKFDIFEIYMRSNNLSIVVPGALKYANVGCIVYVSLKGNNMYVTSQIVGDVVSSGKYFIASVNDRIIGDKLIHKINLCRLNRDIGGNR